MSKMSILTSVLMFAVLLFFCAVIFFSTPNIYIHIVMEAILVLYVFIVMILYIKFR